MILVVAEKPSVAATIATVLGATQKGVNYIYNDKYIVSWCLGHLVTLDDPDMYDKNMRNGNLKTYLSFPISGHLQLTKLQNHNFMC